MPTLSFTDQAITGDRSPAVTLSFPTEEITVRQIIRERVYQEVQDKNQGGSPTHPLVSPGPIEQILNSLKTTKLLDWRPQFEKACQAFEANRFLVLIDDKQADSLDEPLILTHATTVTFLRLTPLVGG